MQTQTNKSSEQDYNKFIENKNFLNNQNYVISNPIDKSSKSYGFYFIDGKIVVLNIFSNKDKFIPIPKKILVSIMLIIYLTLISIYIFLIIFYK